MATTIAWGAKANTVLVWNGIVPEGTAPTITSASAFSVNEGVAFSTQLVANQDVTWQLVGGADQARFSITAAGLLSLPPKSYAAPSDSDLNNVYVVQAEANNPATSLNAIATILVTVLQVVSPTIGQPTGLLLAITKAS